MFAFLLKKFSILLNQEVSLIKNGERISHIGLGNLGEKIARQYVRAHGGKLLYRNFRGSKGGEIDIVARDANVLCFIEVKTRSFASQHSRPMDAVDAKKRRFIVQGAHAWMNLISKETLLWRYDVVEVVLREGKKPEVNWVKQAFTEEGIR